LLLHQAAAAVLREIGVTVRLLDFHGLTSFNPYTTHKHDKDDAGSPKAARIEDKKELLKWHDLQKQQHMQKKAALVGKSGTGRNTERAIFELQAQSASSNGISSDSSSSSSTDADSSGSRGRSIRTRTIAAQQQQQQQQQQQRPPSSSATGQQQSSDADESDPEHLARFTIKVAALVLSSFEEVSASRQPGPFCVTLPCSQSLCCCGRVLLFALARWPRGCDG
jgi:hypothetical protein